ncbi:hypothetical protein RGQ13_14390 [Thalassotalea psychrophila]|uniref:Methyltransferase FkbM domain-containing protein n=1 Tax=Thalassotalea psychrophila TaxID=3065647 RepID=A0ABY9TRY8_9GAMM|nr:hypothetical protein RGQ13_14390 [Colwelliaceae bacterium SQ149]
MTKPIRPKNGNATLLENASKNIGAIVHVGAGNCNELEDYLALKPEQIVLIEPVPQFFNKLTKKAAVNKKIKLFNVALSSDENKHLLHLTQPVQFSSLNKAVNLKKVFKNLKDEKNIEVNTLSFTNLIERLALDCENNNSLILQMNGSEYDCLNNSTIESLTLFTNITVQVGKYNYFENASNESKITQLMINKGFQLEKRSNEGVIFSELTFKQDKNVQKIKKLERKLLEVESYNLSLKTKQAELIECNKSKDEQIANLTVERDEEASCRQKNEEWAESLKLQVESLKTELKEKSRSSSVGKKMLTKAQIDLDHLRESYSQKVTSEKELVNLVKELRKNLILASRYYQQLQQESPELFLASENVVDN